MSLVSRQEFILFIQLKWFFFWFLARWLFFFFFYPDVKHQQMTRKIIITVTMFVFIFLFFVISNIKPINQQRPQNYLWRFNHLLCWLAQCKSALETRRQTMIIFFLMTMFIRSNSIALDNELSKHEITFDDNWITFNLIFQVGRICINR